MVREYKWCGEVMLVCALWMLAGWLAGWWDFEFLNPTGTTQRARFCQRVDATRWKVGCNELFSSLSLSASPFFLTLICSFGGIIRLCFALWRFLPWSKKERERKTRTSIIWGRPTRYKQGVLLLQRHLQGRYPMVGCG